MYVLLALLCIFIGGNVLHELSSKSRIKRVIDYFIATGKIDFKI